MDSNYEDSDDSSIFLKSLGQKRKSSDNVTHKNFKQAKLNLAKSQQNTETNTDKEPDILRKNSMSDDCFPEIIGKDGTKSCKSFENEPGANESISSYFDERRYSNTCPLCLKRFETDSGYATHMKQCAKKRKMTTQQLLTALELQKKQIEERRALGLPSQIIATKKTIPKKKAKEDLQSDYDLALGLALSKSLDPKESQKSTLKEFGFTYNGPGPSKKITDLKKWILKERTEEDRRRIVTEKAAVVLLDEDEKNDSGNVVVNRNSCCRNNSLTKFQNKVPRLWNLGEDEGNSEWYVNSMKEVMKVGEEEEEDEGKKEEEEEEEGNDSQRTIVTEENLMKEIQKLKLPKDQIHQDWKKMINNDKLSDLLGKTKDLETVYMHSLVLYARCPDVLEKDHDTIFSKYSLSTILIFLEYLYCGTLNGLTFVELENLSKLALDLNYSELANVLNRLENSLAGAENSEGIIPSSLTPDEEARSEENEIAIIDVRKAEREDEEVTIVPDERDLFAEEIDLTQSQHGSPARDEYDSDEVESNANKSYWSFLQERRREKLKAEMKKKEEEKEKSMISVEMEKIKTSMEQQDKSMQKIYREFEENESSFKRNLEVDGEEGKERRRRSRSSRSSRSNDSATKDLFENAKSNEDGTIDCIVLSSDSETRASRGEEEDGYSVPVDVELRAETNLEFEAPYFDPYDNINNFSNCNFSPVIPHSQSLVSEIAPFPSPLKKTSNERSLEKEVENSSRGPEYFSTPVTQRQSLSRIRSSEMKSREKRKKRKSALGGSLIMRKSLGLKTRSISSSAKNKSAKRRKSSRERKNLARALTNSMINELSTSLMAKTSTPVQNRFVETTPRTTRDVEFGESVTPSPNFSQMGESMLKEHLSKYGLKKSLAKTKARKILRHIYEELHPILNTETGKFVKIVSTENLKGRKKSKPKKTEKKSNQTKSKKQKDLETATKEQENNLNDSLAKHPDLMSEGSVDSFERSTDYDSDGSEFEGIQEPLTQSAANNPVDLPSAFNEFLQKNPEFHQKVLLFEPIWLEDLQRQLKEVYQKHFKLTDLMDYLDQKCITFRSEAQKKGNEKKNQKTKKSKLSKEKKSCSS